MSFFSHTKSIRAVIFDFDGTLAVSTLDYAFMRHQVDRSMAAFGSLPHNAPSPVLERIACMCKELPPHKAQEAYARAMETIQQVELEAAQRSQLFPFVMPMLQQLREKHIPLGIVTRNCQEAISTVFPEIYQYFSCVITRHDVSHVKPHPTHLLTAVNCLKVQPPEALMIGDHPTDIVAGRNAGTKTGAVYSGESSIAALAIETPDFIAENALTLLQKAHVLTSDD